MAKTTLIRLIAAAAVLASAPAFADFPDKPIRLVNPYAAGAGAMDVAARIMAEKMTKTLGSPVVVVNQPGAGGTVAAAAAARGAKDGYTIYFGTSSTLGYSKLLNKDQTYDPIKDFTPLALLGSVPVGIFTSASGDIRTLQDLIAQAKAKPGQLNYGSPGVGTLTHIAVEMIEERAGVDMKHVPYGGSLNYWNDLVGGQLHAVSGGITGGLPLVRDGRLRLIATATEKRTSIAPDVPAVGELIPGFDVPAWLGIVVAAGTPEPIVAKLEAASLAAFSDPELKAALGKAGIDVTPMGRTAFTTKMARDLTMWEGTLKRAGLLNPAAAKP